MPAGPTTADQDKRAAAAIARLREEQQALATMTEQRRQAEAYALEERIRLEELRRLTAVNQRLASDAQFSDQYAPTYPVYLRYPVIARRCVHCVHPRPPLTHKSASFARARERYLLPLR